MRPAIEPAVLVIGEALVDIVDAGPRITEHVGGSPANVALGLGRSGIRCALLTQLGRDARGSAIVEHLSRSGVDILTESFLLPRTSTAVARIAPDGQAEYEFDVTWDVFAAPDVAPPHLLHTGSIAAFLEPGASSVRRILRESAAPQVTFDPNIRSALMPAHDSAVRVFEETASLATTVKMSDQDAAWLYPQLEADAVIDKVLGIGPGLVAVTLGERGAIIASPQARVHVPAPRVEAVDTIGAGDTFMASLIQSLLVGVAPDRASLARVGADAVHAAAITVSRAGADLPWASEVVATLKPRRPAPAR